MLGSISEFCLQREGKYCERKSFLSFCGWERPNLQKLGHRVTLALQNSGPALRRRSVSCAAPDESLQHTLDAALTQGSALNVRCPEQCQAAALHQLFTSAGCKQGPSRLRSRLHHGRAQSSLTTLQEIQPWFSHCCPDPSRGPAVVQHKGSQARLARSGFGS